VTELDRGAKELIALAGDGDAPTEKQRSRLRAAVLAEIGTSAVTASAGGAVVSAAAGAGAATAIGAVASAGAGAGAGAAVAGGSVAAFAVKMVAIGAVLTGIGTGGYVVASHRSPHEERLVPVGAVATVPPKSPESMVAIGATARSGGPSPVAATAEPEPTPPPAAADEAEPASPPPGPVPTTHHASRVRSTPVSEAVPETLEEETQALRQALSSLRNGHADAVLPALDEQDARYAHGALGEERAAARVEALCALGRTGEANVLASRFLLKHPKSLQAARVRASCGGAQGAP
jgi:hypothetical protein